MTIEREGVTALPPREEVRSRQLHVASCIRDFMRPVHLIPSLALTLLLAAAACSSTDTGTTSTGAGGSTSATSTGESTGTPGEKCSFSDPPAGSTAIRVSVIGVAALGGKKAAWRVREKGGAASVVAASELLGGGPFCPGWVAADPTKSYEVDVVLDLSGNGTCDEPPTDAVLTGVVPAFVNGIAEIDFVYDGTSNGACGDFMLP